MNTTRIINGIYWVNVGGDIRVASTSETMLVMVNRNTKSDGFVFSVVGINLCHSINYRLGFGVAVGRGVDVGLAVVVIVDVEVGKLIVGVLVAWGGEGDIVGVGVNLSMYSCANSVHAFSAFPAGMSSKA